MNNATKGPPRWPLKILERFCLPAQLEILYGDVEEVFFERLEEGSRFRAQLLYYRDAFSLLRSFVVKPAHEIHSSLNFFQMLLIFLKTGFRSLRKHAMSTSLNFLGLLLGMTATLLLAHYAYSELNFDRFHSDYEHVYRLAYERTVNNEPAFHGATTYLPLGPTLKQSQPAVEEQVRLYYPFTHGVIQYQTEAHVEEKPVFADASFFEVFNFPLMQGNKATVLSGPNKVVLSERLVEAYFGRESGMGKEIKFSFEDGEALLQVVGIMPNTRPDTHLQVDMLISFETLGQWPTFENSKWALPFYHTYVRTSAGADLIDLATQAATIIGENARINTAREVVDQIHFQALQDIHLDSDLTFELGPNGDRSSVYLMIGVAALIMLVAYLNYINLSTALATVRAKEVGLRKVMGSTRKALVQQFLVESTLLNVLALLMAIGLTALLLPFVSRVMALDLNFLTDGVFWLVAVLITVSGALAAGVYPAFVLSAYKPVSVLKGQFNKSTRGVLLRKALVGTQFFVSILMIGATMVLLEQTSFLINKDQGFDAMRMLVINAPRHQGDSKAYVAKVDAFANELTAMPKVRAFTHSGSVPGKVMGSGSFKVKDNVEKEAVTLQINSVDQGFFEAYGLNFKSGRAFSKELQTDRMSLIVNEAALEFLGIDDHEQALNEKLEALGREFSIVGVIENYHHSSMKTRFEPIAFVLNPSRTIFFSLNLDQSGLLTTLDEVEAAMKVHFPESPFDYFFLKDDLQNQFQSDLKLMTMFRAFSLLAVILGALGLFGLSSFIASQRMKEMGVRRVLGATGFNLLEVISGTFRWPLVIGGFLATTALYLGANEWLSAFPFRTSLAWTVFGIPLVIILVMAGAIAVFQTIRLISKNPIHSLRSE